MSDDFELPLLPDLDGFVPRMMTIGEIRTALEALFGWLNTVEAMPDAAAAHRPTDALVQRVRDAANLLLTERRERHADETAPRGG